MPYEGAVKQKTPTKQNLEDKKGKSRIRFKFKNDEEEHIELSRNWKCVVIFQKKNYPDRQIPEIFLANLVSQESSL